VMLPLLILCSPLLLRFGIPFLAHDLYC